MNSTLELLPFVNLMAISGLIIITGLVLIQKKRIEDHQYELNQRLDTILNILLKERLNK